MTHYYTLGCSWKRQKRSYWVLGVIKQRGAWGEYTLIVCLFALCTDQSMLCFQANTSDLQKGLLFRNEDKQLHFHIDINVVVFLQVIHWGLNGLYREPCNLSNKTRQSSTLEVLNMMFFPREQQNHLFFNSLISLVDRFQHFSYKECTGHFRMQACLCSLLVCWCTWQ